MSLVVCSHYKNVTAHLLLVYDFSIPLELLLSRDERMIWHRKLQYRDLYGATHLIIRFSAPLTAAIAVATNIIGMSALKESVD